MSATDQTALDDLRRRLRQTSGRGRKLRGLLILLSPYRTRVWLMFVALVACTAATIAPALLIKLAIDNGIEAGNLTYLYVIVGLFVLAALIVWLTSWAQTYLTNWVGQRALQDLRGQIFGHLQRMPVGFYERRPAGVLISRMTNDVEALSAMVTDSVVTLFSSSLLLLGSIVLLLTFSVELALLTFLVFPVIIFASWLFRVASVDAFARTRVTIGAITGYLQETLSGIRVVRSFGQEPRHAAAFSGFNEDNRDANMKTVYLNAAYFPSVELISALATVMILIVGGNQVMEGNLSIGTLIGFVGALNAFFDPIGELSQVYTTYQSGMAALDKIFELLDEEPELTDAPGAIDLPVPLRGQITFEDVTFAYDTDDGQKLALDNICLDVPPGQTVALVGATGAGKSTFAKLVARFYDPTSGRVLVDGHDVREVTSYSLRSQMGIVPQEAFLFSGTIRDNIEFGRPGATDEELESACRALGAWEFISKLDSGLDEQIGERGVQLSAGQRQLIAFARALVADPRILVLDEATSNVDLRTEDLIEAGLRRLLANRTSLVIAHRLSTIRQAARIVVLEHGKIVEMGTHDELLQAEGHYFRLYRDWTEQAAA